MKRHTNGVIEHVDISVDVWNFGNHDIEKHMSVFVVLFLKSPTCDGRAVCETHPHLHSLTKPTRTLITLLLSGKMKIPIENIMFKYHTVNSE